MEGLDGLIFKEKQVRMLSLLVDGRREWHLSDLAKESGTTYVHASRFVAMCEDAGLVGSEMHGKTKRIFLTDKGRGIAAKIGEIRELAKVQEPAAQAAQQEAQKDAVPDA